MRPILLLAAKHLDLSQRLEEALTLTVVGMLVVFTALCLTAIAIVLLKKLVGQDAATSARTPSRTAPAEGDGIEDAHLKVVLAAAAATALGRQVRINKITPAHPPSP